MIAKRVLICEDDRLVQRAIKMIVEREGGFVEQAFEGGEAFGYLEHENYDLVIMDIHMPFASGLELISHLRNVIQSLVPVIVLTALSDRHIREQALQLGANLYIIKPVDPDRLIRLINELLNP